MAGSPSFFTNKGQMVAHAKKFRLFTDVEVIPQILLIGSIVQTIDEILQSVVINKECWLRYRPRTIAFQCLTM